jgi:hypothetical protein
MERITLELEKAGQDKEAQQYKEQSSVALMNPATHAEIVGE